MTQACEDVLRFLKCEYELFDAEADDKQIWTAYREARAEWERGGAYPMLIVPSDTLAEMLELFCEADGEGDGAALIARRRGEQIAQARELDGEAFLRGRLAEYTGMHEGEDLTGEFLPVEEGQREPYIPREAQGEVILARLPLAEPWETAVWVPMGGFNDCLPPAQQAAVFRRWQERYGALPALVSYDIWELTVDRPVRGDADCEALAEEHFAFSYDNVMQSGAASIRGLASGLRGAEIWTFWWD